MAYCCCAGASDLGSANVPSVVDVSAGINVLRTVFVQIFVEIAPLRRSQAIVFDIRESLAAVGGVQPLKVKQRHVPAAEEVDQETVLPACSGHIEDGAGQRRHR